MTKNLLVPFDQSSPHCILLNGQTVEFHLKRNRGLRAIGLKVDFAGLTVTAPLRASVRSISDVLHTHADWVLKKVEAWRRNAPPKVEWRHGASLPFLGRPLPLNVVVQPRRSGTCWSDLTGLNLVFATQPDHDVIKTKVFDWYRFEARRYFPQRIAHLAAVANIATPRFFLSNAHSRWGSCSVDGDIRMTWRLMKAAPHVIDYVAAHELAHLAHMDHSPRFWRRLAEIFPDYEAARDELRHNDALYRIF
ncbi:MAG: SprT family zinc-dependent metalloprotease [Burkholderiales bacterium]